MTHTPKLRIPVGMVQFLLKLLLKQICCCTPRFPLILKAKFHPLYVKESDTTRSRKFGKAGVGSRSVEFYKVGVGVGNFVKVGVGVGYFNSNYATLVCTWKSSKT